MMLSVTVESDDSDSREGMENAKRNQVKDFILIQLLVTSFIS